jgi:ABC-type uncharacterized transport system ATPase subunit
MRRKLDLTMGLVGDPRIVFLDEPITGLDPRSRQTMWQLITELAASGVTIFQTTQYLDEADRLIENQPFIPIIDTLRALLMGDPTGNRGHVSVAWCIGLTHIGYLWAQLANCSLEKMLVM